MRQTLLIRPKGLNAFLILGVLLAAGVFVYESFQRVPFQVRLKSSETEVQSLTDPVWMPLERGQFIHEYERVRTGKKGQVLLKISEDIQVRLEGESLFQGKGPRFYEQSPDVTLNLFQGSLQAGAGERLALKEGILAVQTPRAVFTTDKALFRIEVDPETGREWFGVLNGRAEVYLKKEAELHPLQSLERLVLLPEDAPAPQAEENKLTQHPLSPREWKQFFSAYGLMIDYGDNHRQQNLLSKEAGGFFDTVFNHGDFYTGENGFAYRHFYRNGDGQIILRTYYDVYLRGSFVGTYMQCQDLSTTDYRSLEFEVRRPLEAVPSPDLATVEIKSGSRILKNVYLKDMDKSWKKIRIMLPQEEPAQIDEVVVVFRHSEVGEHKQGYLEFKNFELVK